MRRGRTSALTASLALVVAGCGSAGDSAVEEAESVALEWARAVDSDRLEDACALMTDSITVESEFNETDSLTCETALGAATGAVPAAPDSAEGDADGDSATVTVTGDGPPVVVHLVDDAGWKVDEY